MSSKRYSVVLDKTTEVVKFSDCIIVKQYNTFGKVTNSVTFEKVSSAVIGGRISPITAEIKKMVIVCEREAIKREVACL